jgi:hypothetical protein
MNDDGTTHIDHSLAEASQLLMDEELRRWMGYHNPSKAQQMTETKNCKRSYKEFIHSLRLDRHPQEAATVLLDSMHNHNDKIEHNDTNNLSPAGKSYDETIAGRIIRQRLSKELRTKPQESILSPGLVLTEARRKDIIRKLETGQDLECESATRTMSSPIPHHTFDERNKSPALKTTTGNHAHDFDSPKRIFRPKWEHYDTMKTRWTFVQPQTKQLVASDEMLAPTSVTSTFPVKNSTVTGNIVEIHNFLSRSQLSTTSIHEALATQRRRR